MLFILKNLQKNPLNSLKRCSIQIETKDVAYIKQLHNRVCNVKAP